MQLNVEMREPVQRNAGSAEASQPWIHGPIAVEDGTLVKSSMRPYSFSCECPDNCLRDHENE